MNDTKFLMSPSTFLLLFVFDFDFEQVSQLVFEVDFIVVLFLFYDLMADFLIFYIR